METTSPETRWWSTSQGVVSAAVSSPPVPSRSVVLLLPAFGYESSTAFPTVRAVAEALAADGQWAFRVDLPGAGDAGGPTGAGSLAACVAALSESIQLMRDSGATTVGVVGLRLGALIALQAATTTKVDALVLWAPATGRRHVRELTLIGEPVPPHLVESAVLVPDSIVIGGWLHDAAFLADVSATHIDGAVVGQPPVLVVDRDDRRASDALVAALRSAGTDVEHVEVAGQATFLDRPSEYAEVGRDAVDAIAHWFASGSPEPGFDSPGATAATVGWSTNNGRGPDERVVHEESLRLGAHGLAGILTRGDVASRNVVLMLNSGADPHHGPGRAWVELARSLAVRGGVDAVRLDARSWGDSPSHPTAAGRPYDPHHSDDAADAAEALLQRGYDRVIMFGLCAGAWSALDCARRSPVDGVLALNAQLYWKPGDPVEATMAETRVRRAGEIEDIHRRAVAGEWDRADEAGDHGREGRWLDELVAREVPVTLLFAEGDDGLVFLRDRLARRNAELEATDLLRVREVPDVDHSLTRMWLRESMFSIIADELDRLFALKTSSGH